jgi:hypothetical protein
MIMRSKATLKEVADHLSQQADPERVVRMPDTPQPRSDAVWNSHRLCWMVPVQVLPPLDPTEAMLDAARDWSATKYGKAIGNDAAIGCWRAMMSAATKADPEL